MDLHEWYFNVGLQDKFHGMKTYASSASYVFPTVDYNRAWCVFKMHRTWNTDKIADESYWHKTYVFIASTHR